MRQETASSAAVHHWQAVDNLALKLKATAENPGEKRMETAWMQRVKLLQCGNKYCIQKDHPPTRPFEWLDVRGEDVSRVSPSLKPSSICDCEYKVGSNTVSPSDDTSRLLKAYKGISQSHFQYFHDAVGHGHKIIVSQERRNQGNGALKIAPVRQPVHGANAVWSSHEARCRQQQQ